MSLLTRIAKDAHKIGIGNTPLFKLGNTEIYSKLEYYNRFRSIKDRAAFFMLDYALKTGRLKSGMTVIEGSSGNTGIAIAGISQFMGLKSEIIVPESTPEETVKILERYGSDVIITPGNSTENSINYAIKKALANPDKYFRPGQHENEMNSNAHYYSTGPEIEKEISKPDHLVIGIGTGGTITGLSRFFKERGNIKVTGLIPENGSHITGLRNPFISNYNSIIEEYKDYIDEIVTVSQDDAYKGVRELKEKYNLFCRPFVWC